MKFGDETVTFFEIDQPFCAKDWGTTNAAGNCSAVFSTAVTRKCYQSRFTCSVPNDYVPAVLTLRFGRSQEGTAKFGPLINSLIDVSTTPGAINLGGMDRNMKALGQREQIKVALTDHPHSDLLVDKYRLERATGAASSPSSPFDPYRRGSFWSKWLARNPYYSAYRCRVREGTMDQALADMRVRNYVMSSVDGPTEGKVSVVAKDLFSLVAARKSMFPKASNGRLAVDMASGGATATLAPAGIGNTEYPASGEFRIGDEVMSFTRVNDVCTITAHNLYNTKVDSHSTEDRVQMIGSFVTMRCHDIAYALLTQYGNIPAASIDKASWDASAVTLISLYTARITEPTPVEDLIGELEQQAGFTVWPDVSTGSIEFSALVATDVSTTVDDDGYIIDGSLQIKRQDTKRTSQVWVYYAQIDPTKKVDDPNNFRSRIISADLSSEGPTKYGTPAVQQFYSRWIPQFGRSLAQKFSDRIITMFVDPPIEATFKVFASKAPLFSLARLFNLLTYEVQDDTGAQLQTTHAAVQITGDESQTTLRSQQVKFVPIVPGAEQIIQIENNSFNLNLRTIWNSLYATPTAATVVRFIVIPGVTIGSTATGAPAIRTGSWPAGVTITFENQGRVEGKGGRGGKGGGADNGKNGAAGESGGDALLVEAACSVDNLLGQLWAGGGAGGGGAGTDVFVGVFTITLGAGAGAGAAGINPGEAGDAGVSNPGPSTTPMQPGPSTGGSSDAPGSPSNGVYYAGAQSGNGGVGGGPGQDGAAGSGALGDPALVGAPGAGGVKGKYVNGNALVTWVNNGDRRGAVA